MYNEDDGRNGGLGEDEILDYASTKKMAERMVFHGDAGYLAP
jgi:hypothetical protein